MLLNERLLAIVICASLFAGSMTLLSVSGPGEDGVPGPRALPSTRSITITPYLNNLSATGVTVRFRTDDLASGSVSFSEDYSFSTGVGEKNPCYYHELPIDGLKPDTVYHYYVSAGSNTSDVATFRTASSTNKFTFAVYGDTRTGHTAHWEVIDLMHSYDPEFYLSSGDLVASGNLDSDWDTFFGIIDGYSNDTCYWPSLGNHDLDGSRYMENFSLPGNERYYSFDYGNAHFIALDTNLGYANGTAQNNWLRADLQVANSWAEWIFVYFHHPPYSSGSHGSDLGVRNNLCWLFGPQNVSAVFNGHDHDYEHAEPGDGVHYFVAGGGGAPLYSVGTSWFTTASGSIYHFMLVEIDDNITTIKVIKKDNTTFETIKIYHPDKRAPPAVPVTASDTGRGGEVEVNWSAYQVDVPADFDEFRLYYSTTDFSDVSLMTEAQTLPAGTYDTKVSGLTNGTTYYFAVAAVDLVGNRNVSVVTDSAIPTDITPPAVPTGLTVTGMTEYTINITWDANTDADLGGYYVFVNGSGTGSGGPYNKVGGVFTQTWANVTTLSPLTTYFFVVQSVDLKSPVPNNSTYSAEASGTTLEYIVPNSPPVLVQPLPSLTFEEDHDEAVYLMYDDVFFDPDGDDLSVTFTSSPDLIVAEAPNGSCLEMNPQWHFYGNAWIFLTANDTQYQVSANISVTVNPVNDRPYLYPLADGEVYQYSYLNFTLTAEDKDPLDTITFHTNISEVLPGASADTAWAMNDTGGFWFHPVDQALTGTEDEAEYPVAFWVSDGTVNTYSNITITVKNTNDPPDIISDFNVIIVDAAPVTAELENLTISLVAPEVFDMDGDEITYQWNPGDSKPYRDGKEIEVKYNDEGEYQITLFYTDGFVTLNFSKKVEVFDVPEVEYGDGMLPDIDVDGIADFWELQYGLDPNDPSDAQGDMDDDGYTNLEEFQKGSDPTDPDDPGSSEPPVVDDDDDDDDDAGFLGLSSTLWMILGGGLFVVILIIVVILLLVLFLRKGKDKQVDAIPPEEERVVPGPEVPDIDAAYQAPVQPPPSQPAAEQQLIAPEIPEINLQVQSPYPPQEAPWMETVPPVEQTPSEAVEEDVQPAEPPMELPQEETPTEAPVEPGVMEDPPAEAEEEDPFAL